MRLYMHENRYSTLTGLLIHLITNINYFLKNRKNILYGISWNNTVQKSVNFYIASSNARRIGTRPAKMQKLK